MRQLPLTWSVIVALTPVLGGPAPGPVVPGPALAAQTPAGVPSLRVVATITPTFELADHRAVDVDGKPGAEIVAIGASGEVRTFALREGTSKGPFGTLVLADARHAVFAFAPLAGEGAADLCVASPRGLEVFRAGADGAFGAEPVSAAPRARMRLRTGVPIAAPLALDIDGDGLTDAVVPDGERLEIWVQRPATGTGASAAPTFVKSATVKVPVSATRATGHQALSDELRSAITIPGLRRVDVNGDGRLDLVVEEGETRAFHLVRADGTIPLEPDSTLDLSIFRDTTAEASIAPGRTLAGLDRALHEMRDLDRDGIPDHVVAHRRKVWVFRGGKDAPRFQTPTSVLKTADDVTALLLLDLDGDERPDLVLIKVQVPTVATLLRGLVSEWEIQVAALGYKAGGERDFEPTPAWRSELSFRVPAILSILKDPEAILRRFEDAGKKLRASDESDVDGDGRTDAVVVSEDGARLDLWLGDAAGARAAGESAADTVRRVLFEDKETTWDLDRLVAWLSGWAERRVQALTGGRPAAAGLALRDPAKWRLSDLEAVDLDGDARAEVILRYDAIGSTQSVFDLVSWR